MTCGDETGRIWVYDVGEQLAIPQADEGSKFAYTLQDIKNNQQDDDLDGTGAGGGHGKMLGGGGLAGPVTSSPMSMTAVPGAGGSGPGSLGSLPSLTGSPMR